jgi:hypothetical protein
MQMPFSMRNESSKKLAAKHKSHDRNDEVIIDERLLIRG